MRLSCTDATLAQKTSIDLSASYEYKKMNVIPSKSIVSMIRTTNARKRW